jgi:spore coat polysaccharide biosynthesis predicted glycosyltransferase SpsG
MREEFIQARSQIENRSGKVKRLLIFMGGTDPTSETLKVLQALEQSNTNFEHIDVVVGNGNIHKEKIDEICLIKGYSYHCQVNYMAELMIKADFSIGAGGSATWERCYVGLPSSSTIVAENQRDSTKMAAQLGAVWNLGWYEDVQIHGYTALLNELPQNKNRLKELSQTGLSMTTSGSEPNPWLKKILEMMK